MIPIVTTFHYTHPLGARTPYFKGLLQARAVANRCGACGRGYFPPRACCGADFQWEELAGTGTVVAATDGFALIAMDGADNLALGAMREPALPGCRVRLMLASEPTEHPAQAAWFQVLTGSCIASE